MNRQHTLLLIVLFIAAGATGAYYIHQANEPEFTDPPQLPEKIGALNCTITNETITINTAINVLQPDKVYPITDKTYVVLDSPHWIIAFHTNLSQQALTTPQHPTKIGHEGTNTTLTPHNITITPTNQFTNHPHINDYNIQFTTTITTPNLTTPQKITLGYRHPPNQPTGATLTCS